MVGSWFTAFDFDDDFGLPDEVGEGPPFYNFVYFWLMCMALASDQLTSYGVCSSFVDE